MIVRAFGCCVLLLSVLAASAGQQVIIVDPQRRIYYAGTNDRSVRALPVQENIYMIVGAGANITVQIGSDGVLIVDSGSGAAMNEKVRNLVRQLSTKSTGYVINTSSRSDHTGGNDIFADTASFILWPFRTYRAGQEDLYFNNESIQVLHVPAAVTAGDSMVYFRRSDVVAAGDIFQTTTYPLIDVKGGGSINGLIAGLNQLLNITIPKEKQEGGTLVIPGHGRISDEADVVEYRDMVTIIRDRVQDAIRQGKTLEQVQAARLARDYDPRYGPAGTFVEAVYHSLKAKP
jgi:glyoxylase-like metal-dependent hydrolase (beta-lactamase superfamily II)